MSTQHPTFQRMQAIARTCGSKATTVRGVAAFFREFPAAKRALERHQRPTTAAEWQRQDAARRADPEAKRARHDKAFRRRYLARLNRREKAALACDGTLEAVIQFNLRTTMSQRYLELGECARLRSIVTGRHCHPQKSKTQGFKIHVGENTAKLHGVKLIMRGANAHVEATRSESHLVHEDAQTEWRGGRAVGYTRAVNDNYVRSIAVIRDNQTVDYCCHETRYSIVLPDGYHWDSDEFGLRVVLEASPADDFHPTASDLYNHVHGILALTTLLLEHRKDRLEHEALAAAECARISGVYVCLADSLRAGNCRAGSLEFARKHQLNPAKHYEAPALLQQANGDAGRVRLAITAAIMRHQREMERGYCNLAEHTVVSK